MAEVIEIFDANLKSLGSMDRVQAHMEGQWHQTFHCWIASNQYGGAVLFQKRSDSMQNFPGCFDVSAAGHIEYGETVEQGVREVNEELGLRIGIADLHDLGYRVEVADQANGQRNREYQAVYLGQQEELLSNYRPQVEEVAGLYWLPIKEGYRIFQEADYSTAAYGIRLNEQSLYVTDKRLVSKRDFLPRIQRYYVTILVMAERMLEGRYPLTIS